MLSFTTIKNKEIMSYQDEYVYDEMIGRWVTVSEYEDFVQALIEEQQIDTGLKYPEYQMVALQEAIKDRALENKSVGQSTII